jgi:hypothetical protein
MKRLLMTGVRAAGAGEFEFTVYGNQASDFPPIRMTASAAEFREWLAQARHPERSLAESGGHAAPALRLVK